MVYLAASLPVIIISKLRYSCLVVGKYYRPIYFCNLASVKKFTKWWHGNLQVSTCWNSQIYLNCRWNDKISKNKMQQKMIVILIYVSHNYFYMFKEYRLILNPRNKNRYAKIEVDWFHIYIWVIYFIQKYKLRYFYNINYTRDGTSQ